MLKWAGKAQGLKPLQKEHQFGPARAVLSRELTTANWRLETGDSAWAA
jgi:hypothetical protein